MAPISRTLRMPGFCVRRVTAHVRVRSQPLHQANPTQAETDHYKQQLCGDDGDGDQQVVKHRMLGRRIMVVVEPNFQAKSALQWALSHGVQNEDVIVLLFVMKPSKQGHEGTNREIYPGVYKLLCSMKKMCQIERPEVQVDVAVVEESEKGEGQVILEEAKKREVSLLVLGQRKRSIMSRLLIRLWKRNYGRTGDGGVVEYCIQNANCLTIAVRRKSRKLGGYLITTRRHKNFWLLA